MARRRFKLLKQADTGSGSDVADFFDFTGVANGYILKYDSGSGLFEAVTPTGAFIATAISDFTEAAQDAAGALFTDTATIDFTYNDVSNTVTASAIVQMSITSDASGLKLSGDASTPGNSMYYGTNGSGTKGFYALPSGSGSAANVTPDTHPSSAATADDEFESGSTINLAKWTARNVTAGSATVADGALVLTCGNNGADNMYCYEQAVSGGVPWKYRCKVAIHGGGNQDIRGGMYVVNNANGKIVSLGLYYDGSSQQTYANHNTSAAVYSTTAVITATTKVAGRNSYAGAKPEYLEIEYDGTNVIVRQSSSGISGTFITILQETPATFLGATPTHVGIFTATATANIGGAVFDWFRKIF